VNHNPLQILSSAFNIFSETTELGTRSSPNPEQDTDLPVASHNA